MNERKNDARRYVLSNQVTSSSMTEGAGGKTKKTEDSLFYQTVCNKQVIWGSGLVVRSSDSWSKGRGFEFRQERRENFLLQGQLSVLTYIGIRSTPVYHVKDPGHSAKSVGGRLQLNMHAPYTCGFAWSNMVRACMYTKIAPGWQQFHVAPTMPAL